MFRYFETDQYEEMLEKTIQLYAIPFDKDNFLFDPTIKPILINYVNSRRYFEFQHSSQWNYDVTHTDSVTTTAYVFTVKGEGVFINPSRKL